MDTAAAASALDRLLGISTLAADVGLHEVAFHALMAALHAAEATGSLAAVQRVKTAAETQSRQVENIVPPHPLSSVMAASRGTQPVYHSLQAHAEAVRVRLESEAVLRRVKAD